MNSMEWLGLIYLLTGSTGIGYYFFTLLNPAAVELAEELKIGWAIVLGLIFSFMVLGLTLALQFFGIHSQILFFLTAVPVFLIFSIAAYWNGRNIEYVPMLEEKKEKKPVLDDKEKIVQKLKQEKEKTVKKDDSSLNAILKNLENLRKSKEEK